jgi:hypothetical protein
MRHNFRGIQNHDPLEDPVTKSVCEDNFSGREYGEYWWVSGWIVSLGFLLIYVGRYSSSRWREKTVEYWWVRNHRILGLPDDNLDLQI